MGILNINIPDKLSRLYVVFMKSGNKILNKAKAMEYINRNSNAPMIECLIKSFLSIHITTAPTKPEIING